VGNNYDEYSHDHLSVGARAVYLEGLTLEQYLIDYIERNIYSEAVSLAFNGEMEINGVDYKRLVFYIENAVDSYDNRIMDTFSFERNGFMIQVRFDGWAAYPENERELIMFMYYYMTADANG